MARETIKQRITLDGGEAIKGILEQIGDAGREAFATIKKGLEQAGEAGAPLMKRITDLEASYKRFQRAGDNLTLSTRKVQLGLADVGAAASVTAARLGYLGAAIFGSGGVGAAFAYFVKSALDSVDAMREQAEAAGLTSQAYQELQFAAAQAGVDQGRFNLALATLNEKMAEAAKVTAEAASGAAKAGADGVRSLGGSLVDASIGVTRLGETVKGTTGEANDAFAAFQKIGLSVKDLATLSAEDVITRMADGLSGLGSDAERAQVLIDIFGKRAGASLVSFFKQTAAELETTRKVLRDAGLVVTKEQEKIVDAAGDAQGELAAIAGGFQKQIAVLFAPTIEQGADALRNALLRNKDAILGFAEDLAAKAIPVIEDLIRAFSGEGALGGSQGGEGRNQWIFDLRDAVVDTAAAIEGAVKNIILPAFRALEGVADTVAGVINSVFGTELTGRQLLIAGLVLQLTGGFRLLGAVLGTLRGGLTFFLDLFQYLRTGKGLLVDFVRFIGSDATGKFKGLGQVAKAAGTAIAAPFRGVARLLAPLTGSLGSLLKSFTSLAGVGRLLGGTFGLVGRALAFVGTAIAGIVGAPALLIAGFVALAAATVVYWDDIKGFIADAWVRIKQVLGEAYEGLKAFGRDAFAGLATVAADAWDGVKGAVAAGWEGVKTITADARDGLAQAARDAWEGIKSAGRLALEGAETAAADTWDGAKRVTAAARAGLATVAADTWGAITEAASAIGDRLTPVWEDIKASARGAFQSAATFVLEAWTGATNTVQQSAAAIQAAIARATEIAGDVEGAEAKAASIVAPFLSAQTQIDAVFVAIEARAALAGATIVTALTDAFAALSAALASDGEAVGAVTSAIAAPFEAAAGRVAEALADVEATARASMASILETVQGYSASIRSEFEAMVAALRAAVAEARALRSELGSSGGSSGGDGFGFSGLGSFAGGGQIRGPGTGTSDSVPILASNGEFMMRTAAVKKYGLAFMAAINSLQLPRNLLEGFRSGGLVGHLQQSMRALTPLPAFAGGGLIEQAAPAMPGKTFDLHVGGQTFAGLWAPDDVADQIVRFGVQKAARSAGRKPGWVGG